MHNNVRAEIHTDRVTFSSYADNLWITILKFEKKFTNLPNLLNSFLHILVTRTFWNPITLTEQDLCSWLFWGYRGVRRMDSIEDSDTGEDSDIN